MTLVTAMAVWLSSHSDPAAWAVIGIGVGLYLFYRGFRKLQRKRLIVNTPTSKVRSASIGLVEVSGHAIGPYTIRSPLCMEACYYYKAIAWQLRGSGKDRKWKKVAEEVLHMPFFVDDGTGRLLVDPRGAELDLHRDYHEEFSRSTLGAMDPVPESVRHFLACHGVSTDESIRVDEYLIRPGSPLYVMGTLAENPGLEVRPMPVRDFAGGPLGTLQKTAAAAIQASQTAEMVAGRNQLPAEEKERIFRQQFAAAMGFHGLNNLPAGFTPKRAEAAPPAPASSKAAAPPVISDEEKHRRELFMASFFGTSLATASEGATDVEKSPEAKPEDFDLHPPTVLMKGERERTFFISYRSQRELVAQLAWEATACIWGGPLLTLIGVAYLVSRLNAGQ